MGSIPPLKIVIADEFKYKRYDLDGDKKNDATHGELVEMGLKKRLLQQGIDLAKVEIIRIEVDTNNDGDLSEDEAKVAAEEQFKIVSNDPSVFCISSSTGFLKYADEALNKELGFTKKNEETLELIDKTAFEIPYFQALANDYRAVMRQGDLKNTIPVGADTKDYGQQLDRAVKESPYLAYRIVKDGIDLNDDGVADTTLDGFKPIILGKGKADGNSYGTPAAAGSAAARYIKANGHTITDPAKQKEFKFICANPIGYGFEDWLKPGVASYEDQLKAKEAAKTQTKKPTKG